VDTAVDELGVPDAFIDHATRDQIMEDAGLLPAKIAQDVVAQVLGTRIPVARGATTGDVSTLDDLARARESRD
jgi:1-deoxy-D-xylulose-5-phosphate synthase